MAEIMANPEHLAILDQGVDKWNEWRARNPGLVPDLRGADLSWRPLERINFRHAKLIYSNLNRATLADANLTGGLLGHAKLQGTNLSWANLTRTRLRYVDLTSAIFNATILSDTCLQDAVGLETCSHRSSSYLDHNTLFRNPNLPVPFLRGCGLPEPLIEYLPSLRGQPIQFFSCFISYSTQDQDFAERLHADLQNKGIRCWFAPHDIKGGKKLHEQIDEAIRVYDKLLLILSESSMDSAWVRTEISKALNRQRAENRRMLFPFRLVNYERLHDWDWGDADAVQEVREYFIPDFSNWKNHDEYTKSLDKLITDLKQDDIKKSDASSVTSAH